MTRARRRKLPFGWIIGAITLVAAVFFGMLYYRTEARAGLPKMEIGLASGTTMGTINSNGKEPKYYDNTLRVTEGPKMQEFDDVEIKGRGNVTWTAEKKPYQIKLDKRTNLFGLGKARKWVLLADYFDPTFLRNDVAFWAERMMDEEYAFDGQFVEFYADEIYYGLYYVTHRVNIGKEEINLRDPLGIIVEMDNLWRHPDEGNYSREADYLVTKDVVTEDLRAEAENDFMVAYNTFERAVRRKDWVTVQEYADIESFAKYYLVNEFAGNMDAYCTSFFMYKDGVEDKIHAGPGWDFDMAFGNHEWTWGYNEDFYSSTQLLLMRDRLDGGYFYDEEAGYVKYYDPETTISRTMFNLLEIPEFRDLVAGIWQDNMAGRGEELMDYMAAEARYIERAAVRDHARWKNGDFDEALEYLTNWIQERYAFLDVILVPGEDWAHGEYTEAVKMPEPGTGVDEVKQARPEVPITEVENVENDANGARNKVPVTEANDYSKK